MTDKKTILLVSMAFILVLTMGLHNTGALPNLTEKGLLLIRKWLMDILHLVIAVLAWRWFKKTDNKFFKWLCVAAVISIASVLESMLFNLHTYLDYTSTLFVVVNVIRNALRMALSLLIALLPIYAVANYKEQTKFLAVFTPKWLLTITIFWVFSVVYSFKLQFQGVGTHNLIFSLIYSSVFISLAVYGIKVSLDKYKTYSHTLLKYLVGFFAINIFIQILSLATTALFVLLEYTFNPLGYMHLLTVLIYAGPILIIVALLTYRESTVAIK